MSVLGTLLAFEYNGHASIKISWIDEVMKLLSISDIRNVYISEIKYMFFERWLNCG